MSMSAEEILLNCKRQFDFIKTDINTLLSYIQELLEECKEIDNSNFYTQKLESLIKRVKDEISDLQKADEYAKEVEGQTHVATERYHEIQRYAERKRELIAEFKVEVFALKKDIVIMEQDAMVKNLNGSLYNSFDDLKREIINFYETVDDRTIVQNYFNDLESILRNKTKSELLEMIASHLSEQKQSSKFITGQMINSSVQLYNQDLDVVNAIKNDAKTFLTNSNDGNLFEQAKEFFIKSSRSAENEAIRKDNVIKIVNAIRAVGYIVDENNIRKLEEKNIILIHGQKVTGETADFAVRLDGSFVYNYEGFEGHEHDADADAFLQKLHEQGIQSSEEFNKQYREPKYIAKQKDIINSKKTNSGK